MQKKHTAADTNPVLNALTIHSANFPGPQQTNSNHFWRSDVFEEFAHSHAHLIQNETCDGAQKMLDQIAHL